MNRKAVTIISLLCFCQGIVSARWNPQNPILAGNRWNDVKMFDQKMAVAVGSNGIISHTTDQGKTWETSLNVHGISSSLNAISILPPYEGWVVGDSGVVLHTNDSGLSWSILESGVNDNLYTVVFWDSTTGWAAGDSGIIIRTNDGGDTWNKQITEVDERITSLEFILSTEGWAVGWFKGLLHTQDGGKTWVKEEIVQDATSFVLSSVDFVDELTGWTSTQDYCMDFSCGYVFKTTDGGVTWTNISDPNSWNPFFWQIGFFDRNEGWGLDAWYSGWGGGMGTDIYLTNDGGYTWSPVLQLKDERLLAIDFYNRIYSLAVGTGGVSFRSLDAGTNWERLVSTANLKSVHFVNKEMGWAAGGSGAILHTSNGGLDWEIQNTDTMEDLNAIHFATPDTGWTVGNGGLILKSVDGGNSWFKQNPGTTFPVLSLFFLDTQSGWAAAAEGYYYEPQGLILHTDDGGSTWIKKETTSGTRFEDITFVNSRYGWAVGNVTKYPIDYSFYGAIYRTVDEGQTWDVDTLDFDSRLIAITFVDSLTGWVAGRSLTTVSPYQGIVLKTVDGGLTWSQQFSKRGVWPTDVYFIDHENGRFVNARGSIFSTKDGGETWFEYTYKEWHSLNSLFFVDSQTGWIVGYGGLILNTTDGGSPLSTDNKRITVPKEFHLFQNYPNPFNPTTTIEFSMPKNGLVNLTVYDILGREVEIILNQRMNAGHHKVQWNANNVPSGIYFIRMLHRSLSETSASFSQVRKVTVLR